jgi:hypothetical protein
MVESMDLLKSTPPTPIDATDLPDMSEKYSESLPHKIPSLNCNGQVK